MNPLTQLRGAFYLLVLVLVCAMPFALAQRNATSQSVVKHGSANKELAGIGKKAPANIIVVTNTNDSGPGSLRDALAAANDGDTIDATGVSGTILLTSGELQINHNVTINGPGAANLAINGNATFRVFENFAANATISGFTITNGLPPLADFNGGGGILNHGGLTLTGSSILSNNAGPSLFNRSAGGVRSAGGGVNTVGGTLAVVNSVISNNISGGGGGINFSGDGTLTVTNSVVSGNEAGAVPPFCGGDGGGIAFSGGGTLTVTNSVISENGQSERGGGVSADGATVTVSNSTISGNEAGNAGGGISATNTQLTVMNGTISGNSSPGNACGVQDTGVGGGIECDGNGTLTLINSTIGDNSASFNGGGIWNNAQNNGLTIQDSTFSGNTCDSGVGAIYNSGVTQIGDTILNAGAAGGTIFNDGGTVTSLGYNLASDNGGGVLTGPGDQINTDPMLGPLRDNGGPTFTHALLPGSPAIDAGDPNFTPPPFFDQRGSRYRRVFNGRIDVGSFEVQPSPVPTPRPRPTPHPRPTP